jgi:hypothetical protein
MEIDLKNYCKERFALLLREEVKWYQRAKTTKLLLSGQWKAYENKDFLFRARGRNNRG